MLCKRGLERNLGFMRLRNLGNYRHNISVLESGCGTLRVSKRSGKKVRTAADYLPCVHCLAFLGRDQLWRHVQHCPFNSSKVVTEETDAISRISCCAAAQVFLDGSLLNTNSANLDPDFKAAVLDNMHKDNVRAIAAGDALIANFGRVLFKRLGPQRALDVQQRMRQLARLLQAVNAGDGVTRLFTLDDVIDGSHFDAVVDAVNSVAVLTIHSSGRRMYGKPSLAAKLGHSLKKCAQLKLGMAIRKGDTACEQDANAFLFLHGSEWQDKVSSVCSASFKLAKVNKTQELPSRDDLDKVRNFQTSRIQTLSTELNESPQYGIWRQLAEVTLSRLTLFNKRRGGEAAQLLITQYIQRPNWQATCNPENSVQS